MAPGGCSGQTASEAVVVVLAAKRQRREGQHYGVCGGSREGQRGGGGQGDEPQTVRCTLACPGFPAHPRHHDAVFGGRCHGRSCSPKRRQLRGFAGCWPCHGRERTRLDQEGRAAGHAFGGGAAHPSVVPDVPSNDFRILLAEAAKLDDGENIWASAKAGFAAKRITDTESVHFVMSFSTLHWMQQLPWGTDQATLGGAISYVTLQPSPMAKLRALADEELQGFFSSRMAELRTGGQVVATFDGETSDVSHQFSRTYFLAEKALKSMIEEELLPQDFLMNYFIPTVSYSEERCNAVLAECGLNTIENTFLDIPCPYLLAWQANHDKAKHGEEVAKAFIACFKQQLLDAMAACKVPEVAKGESLLQQLLSRMSKFAAEAPAQFHTGGVTAFVRIAKPVAK